ncbi:MIF4G domain-containing protein [Ditylenchus destructor]|nr:MIF4G domain-containing protein [Ditylenchus destructor]
MAHLIQHAQQFSGIQPPAKHILSIVDPKTQTVVTIPQIPVNNSKDTETAANKSRMGKVFMETVRLKIDGIKEEPSSPIDQNGQVTLGVHPSVVESIDSGKDKVKQGCAEDKAEQLNDIDTLPSPYIRACPRCKAEVSSTSNDIQVPGLGSGDDKIAASTPEKSADKGAFETMANTENNTPQIQPNDANKNPYDKTTLLAIREFVDKNLSSSAFMCPSSEPVFSKGELNDITSGSATKCDSTRSLRHNGSPKDERRNPQNMHSFRPANAYRINKEKPYFGRNSDNGDMFNNARMKKSTVIARSSMQVTKPTPIEQPALKRTSNAWKPKRIDSGEDSEEVKQEKIKRTIRGLLNKLTPSNYEDLSQEMCSLRVYESENLLSDTVNLVFEKAVEEPHFCSLYADLLCLSLIKDATKSKQNVEENQKSAVNTISENPIIAPKLIHDSIMRWCQREFENKGREREIQALEGQLKLNDSDDAKKQELKDRLSIAKTKNKRRAKGINSLISQVYRHGYVTDMIAYKCATQMYTFFQKSKEEEYMEFALHFLETIGPTFENKILKHQKMIQEMKDEAKIKAENCWRRADPLELPQMPEYLNLISVVFNKVTEIRSILSPRLQCLAMNLEDQRKNRWTSAQNKNGLKTLTEIREETQAELQQKDMERRKMNGYGSGRYKTNGGSAYSNRFREQPPQKYHGRGSACSDGGVNYQRGSVGSDSRHRRGSTDSGSSYSNRCQTRN